MRGSIIDSFQVLGEGIMFGSGVVGGAVSSALKVGGGRGLTEEAWLFWAGKCRDKLFSRSRFVEILISLKKKLKRFELIAYSFFDIQIYRKRNFIDILGYYH